MAKDLILDEIKSELVASLSYICKRLERLYLRNENFAPLAKLLIESAITDRQVDGRDIEVEDIFLATQQVSMLIDELEALLNSSIH